jgi:hypothetical protein
MRIGKLRMLRRCLIHHGEKFNNWDEVAKQLSFAPRLTLLFEWLAYSFAQPIEVWSFVSTTWPKPYVFNSGLVGRVFGTSIGMILAI